jgi:hypothetical protein
MSFMDCCNAQKIPTTRIHKLLVFNSLAFMRLHSIHIHDEIESLEDPTEAVLNEFGHHRGRHDKCRNFNDISADEYLRGTGFNAIEY